jgi:hypothetical protein
MALYTASKSSLSDKPVFMFTTALLAMLPPVAMAGVNDICRVSDPAIVTHTLSSGNLVLGISDHGGGYINKLYVPGVGDVMGKISGMYGRGGQSDIRDIRHGVRYNPTAAGFRDDGGTVCTVLATPSRLTIPNRACCLWFGDYRYDFTYWNNLCYDGYRSRGTMVDNDMIPDSVEAGYVHKQAQEITSEFDIFQDYQDRRYTIGTAYGCDNQVTIPAIRHYFHYDFVRDPSAAMAPLLQFPNNVEIKVSDISSTSPSATNVCGAYDMGVLVEEFTWRFQRNLWEPAYCFNVRQKDTEKTLAATDLSSHTNQEFLTYQNAPLKSRVTGFDGWFKSAGGYSPLIILSDSSSTTSGNALGIFFPPTINNNTVAGVRADGVPHYTDDRRIQVQSVIQYNGKGILIGFKQILTGLLNPSAEGVPAGGERVRGEVYFLYGTPSTIYSNAQRICPF